jgi:hypothetical protein
MVILKFQGEDYLFKHGLVENSPMEIAKFLHFTKKIKPIKKREYLNKRYYTYIFFMMNLQCKKIL